MQSWLLLIACLLPHQQPDTLVVCPAEFRQTLNSWVEFRQEQGHQFLFVEPPQSAQDLKSLIQKKASESPTIKTVVLVGDSRGERNLVPTNYIKANVNVLFGAQPEIATDNPFADLDQDGIPDIAIGRISVDSKSELNAMIERVLAYEKNNSGEWLQRINFVAGVGGFGQLVDKLIEQAAKQMITDLIPAGYQTSMTYGSWNSPYCPDPRKFSDTCIQKFNEGCLFWVYIGHGATHQLDRVRLPDRSYNILDESNVTKLDADQGNPIAIFLACSTGGFDHPRDCLAEKMLRQPSGPIAVLASTRVAMPYGLSTFTLELTKEHFEGKSKTLGEAVLIAKQRLVSDEIDQSDFRSMIEAMGSSFSPKPELLAAERKEHADLIHLLGDPLLKIKRAQKLELDAKVVQEKNLIRISGVLPFEGTMKLTVCYKRDRFRFRPPRRPKYDPEEFDSYQEAYDQAQQLVCSTSKHVVKKGEFQLEVEVPEGSNGECVVQAILLNDDDFAIDSAPIMINTKSP